MENEELLNRLQNLENKNSDKYTIDKYKEAMGNFFDGAEQLMPIFYDAVEGERNNYIARKLGGETLEPFNEKAVTNALLNKLADDNAALANILKTLTDRTKDVVDATKQAVNKENTPDDVASDINSDIAGDVPAPEGVDMNTPLPPDAGAMPPAPDATMPPAPDTGAMPPADNGAIPPAMPNTGVPPMADTAAVPPAQEPAPTAVSDRRMKIIKKPRFSMDTLRTALSDFRMKNVKKPVGNPISSGIIAACQGGE